MIDHPYNMIKQSYVDIGTYRMQSPKVEEVLEQLIKMEALQEDKVANSRSMRMDGSATTIFLRNAGVGEGSSHLLTNLAHNQLAQRLDMSTKLYNRLRADKPELLSKIVNHLFDEDYKEEPLLFRLMENKIRAVLSDQYKIIQNKYIFEKITKYFSKCFYLPEVYFTDTNFFFKVVSCAHKIAYIKPGLDIKIKSGVHVFNSEVGSSKLEIHPQVELEFVLNGVTLAPIYPILTGSRYIRAHRGKKSRSASMEEQTELDNQITSSLDEIFTFEWDFGPRLNIFIDKVREASQNTIDQPTQALKKIVEIAKLSDITYFTFKHRLVLCLNGTTQLDIANAILVTASAEYDPVLKFNLEMLGGEILTLSPKEFNEKYL